MNNKLPRQLNIAKVVVCFLKSSFYVALLKADLFVYILRELLCTAFVLFIIIKMKCTTLQLRDSACGLSLRDGSLSIAFAFIVGMCIGLVGYVAYLKGRVKDYYLTSDECFILYVEITVLLLLLVVDIVLVVGVITENALLVATWLLVHVVYALYVLAKFVVAFYSAVVTVEVLYACGVLVFYLSLLVVLAYSLLVVWSYLLRLSGGCLPWDEEAEPLQAEDEDGDEEASLHRKRINHSSKK